jgi:hypothetical protein
MIPKSNTYRIYIFCTIIFAFSAVHLLQAEFNFIKRGKLKGDFKQAEEPRFTIKNWFSGDYQKKAEDYLNSSFGFRNFYVRLNNQIAFNLFNVAKANGVIIGKNNYLFEENYLKAYNGTDFIGKDKIIHRFDRLKFLSDTLRKLNKSLILVFAAGKGSYYPEYFPDRYHIRKGPTNYDYHIRFAKALELNYIDFNRYFIDLKYKSKYPLFARYGIHWSMYGMCIAGYSMIRYIEQLRNIKMPRFYWDTINIKKDCDIDYDIAEGMNLLFRFKRSDMAYPRAKVEKDTSKTRPSVLVIGDSYYFGLFNAGISNAFSNKQFWFYNTNVYPESSTKLTKVDIALEKEGIEKADVIIILATEANLARFGWGFIEDACKLFRGYKVPEKSEYQKKIQKLRDQIQGNAEWMIQIEQKAKDRSISVDSMITLDAIWVIDQEKNK